MLTKLGMTALMATVGTAAIGTPAQADEPCNRTGYEVRYDDGYGYGYGYGYGGAGRFDRREAFERSLQARRLRAFEHARWLRMQHGRYRW